MESLKKLCITIVLATVGYMGYVTLTKPAPDDAAEAPGPAWPEPATVEAPPQALADDALSSKPLPLPGAANDPWNSGTPLPTSNLNGETVSATSTTPTVIAEGTLTPLPSSDTTTLTAPTADSRYPSHNESSAEPAALPGESIGTSSADEGPVALATGIDTSPPSANTRAEFMSDLADAQRELDQNKLSEALLTLSTWYGDRRLPKSDRDSVVTLLDQLAGTVIYSREPWLEKSYIVQPGDSLTTIAERYEVPAELLANINSLGASQQVRPGDELKVMHGPFDAVVTLDDMELTLVLQGRYAGRFRIGVGTDVPLAEGDYTVRNKAMNPTYYGPRGVIDAEDPSNPLGEHSLDLGNHVAIHGTNDPQSIGRTDSAGSIRLDNRDVADVFNILSVGSRITIRR